MQKKGRTIEVIGISLAVLYAVSAISFIGDLKIPEFRGLEFQVRGWFYLALFAGLIICSVAVASLREWGRQLLVLFNGVMIVALAAIFIPKIGAAPFSYFLMNVIILLYFTQDHVKGAFRSGAYDDWHRSILLVDDDEGFVRMVRPILFSHGYSVLTAESGEAGVQVAMTQQPDLVLLDVILPGMKGREVCQKIKMTPETQHIPVIFLTAKDSPEDVMAEKDIGAEAHLTKPVNPKVLIQTIQSVLRSQRGKKKR